MSLTFVELTHEHASALERILLSQVWAHRWSPDLARQVVEWRYWRRPSGQTRLALEDGRCVGLIDCFARPYLVDGQTRIVRESCDWWSEPRLRPAGLGLRLMRKAMAECEVGDDVFGDDPTVNKLQELAASMLGMEAALYVPSGTMGNLIAVLVHCSERGSEIILGDKSHIFYYEQGGIAQCKCVHAGRRLPAIDVGC